MNDATAPISTFPPALDLTPVSRRPLMLPPATVQTVLGRPVPTAPPVAWTNSLDEASYERASIIVVTFNNLVFSRLCMESLLANTEHPNYEVIVVDNGSTDGTASYLRELVRHHPHVQVVFNSANQGFAPANNQALALARGDVLVLLNNDTIVPRGWLTGLLQRLNDPAVGLVGPVTNRIGNEAEIEASYRTYGEFEAFAQRYTQDHKEAFEIRTLCMFCLAMRRDAYEKIGPLDERFETGMLEDDDYAVRARAANYRVVCVEDVFVHHFGEASFGNLVPTGEYGTLLAANRRRFEQKWGVAWEPYNRRLSGRYLELSERIREVVRGALPTDATVLVVSRGDDELLRLSGQQAWHFPQNEVGTYAGYHPADSAEATGHLEALRAKGADFLLFPDTALWWLEHYAEFGHHLRRKYRVVSHLPGTCLIFALREPEAGEHDR